MKVVIKVFTHTFIPTDTLKTSYWEFPCTSILKMCTPGISLHSYLKDVFCGISLEIYVKNVYSGCFSVQLSETRVLWLFLCKSILKMCILGISLDILS